MFELAIATKVKLVDVRVLSQKNRKADEDPGAKLVLHLALPNSALDGFDPLLKRFLFAASEAAKAAGGKAKQQPLTGVDPLTDMPALSGIGAHINVLRWTQEMTGYTLTVDLGLGGKRSNLVINECTLSRWRLRPEEGGTVPTTFDLESQHVADSSWARLAKLKGREITIWLAPPQVADDQQPLPMPTGTAAERKAFFDGPDNPFRSTDPAEAAAAGHKPKPLKAGAPAPDPTAAFVATQGKDEAPKKH